MLGKLRPPLRRSPAKSSLPLVALVTVVPVRERDKTPDLNNPAPDAMIHAREPTMPTGVR